MNYLAVRDRIINKLKNELPVHLYYHNVQHTLDVIDQSIRIAMELNVSDSDLTILKTAALYHDTGFLSSHLNHEEISCKIAKEDLIHYGYSQVDIERICACIMATKIPQTPNDLLAEILCDADLYYLGTDQYSVISNHLLKEYMYIGVLKNEVSWSDVQIQFLNTHRFFTTIVQTECNKGKQKNLQNVNEQKKKASNIETKEGRINLFKDYFRIIVGVILAGIGLKGFLVPNQFIDGGNTGIALLLRQEFGLNLSLGLILLNLPFVFIGYFMIGQKFAIRTIISLVLLGLLILFVPIPGMTDDKLLIAIFGGAFLGTGTGLVMRSGAAIDGIEVLALYTLRKTSFNMTEIIMGINILIFMIAAFIFGPEKALYSILTYIAATRCIDYIVEGLHAYTGVTIISSKSQEIKFEIVNTLGRAITVYKGERGFLPGQFEVSTDVDIVFTIINRLELRKLNNLVYNIDPKAFMYSNIIKDASGGVIKLRLKH